MSRSIRRTATDALVRFLDTDQPEEALAVLEQAFDHDPYSEPLAHDLMRLQARLGRVDTIRRTHRLLTHRLGELDVEPGDDTQQLAITLLSPSALVLRELPPHGAQP